MMMTTVVSRMILAVMIAQAVHVSHKMEMGK